MGSRRDLIRKPDRRLGRSGRAAAGVPGQAVHCVPSVVCPGGAFAPAWAADSRMPRCVWTDRTCGNYHWTGHAASARAPIAGSGLRWRAGLDGRCAPRFRGIGQGGRALRGRLPQAEVCPASGTHRVRMRACRRVGPRGAVLCCPTSCPGPDPRGSVGRRGPVLSSNRFSKRGAGCAPRCTRIRPCLRTSRWTLRFGPDPGSPKGLRIPRSCVEP